MSGRTCDVDGCDERHVAHGYCGKHYRQEGANRRSCSLDGCDRPHAGHGYCSAHLARWHRNGDPGPAEILVLGASETYAAVHQRVHRMHGPASGYPCAACWSPADEWAYDRSDPDEIAGETWEGVAATYSLDLSHYVPLCRSCHRGIDGHFGARRPSLDMARAVELYGQGIGANTIAQEAGCSPQAVIYALRDAGVTIRPANAGAPPSRRTVCRRDHRLIAPNLVERRLPELLCLACRRAETNAGDARRRGGIVWTPEQTQVRADEHYARIMSEGPGTRRERCGRAHRIAPPNVRGDGAGCLACARARSSARNAKRARGEIWTPEQIQAAADAHYARIMGELDDVA